MVGATGAGATEEGCAHLPIHSSKQFEIPSKCYYQLRIAVKLGVVRAFLSDTNTTEHHVRSPGDLEVDRPGWQDERMACLCITLAGLVWSADTA